MTTQANPKVTIVIPARNEERFIGACLDSVLAGDFPVAQMEIIVADGRSTDRTREIVNDYGQSAPVRVIDNPGITAPPAMNRGIAEAKGEYLLRMDAHTVYAPDYVSKCIELLESTGAANVGGSQTPVGRTYFERAVAAVLPSRFAAGSAFWSRPEPTEVASVFLGAWRRSTLLEIGGFNESWTANEDFEVNTRIRRAGGRILYSPEIRAEYQVRSSLTSLARQFFRYGTYRAKTLKNYPDTFNFRHIIPPLFLLALLASLIAIPWSVLPVIVVGGLYGLLLVAASAYTALSRGPALFPALLIVFLTVHFSWGLGFWNGVRRFGLPLSGSAAETTAQG